MNNKILLFVLLLLVAAGGFYMLQGGDHEPQAPVESSAPVEPSTQDPPKAEPLAVTNPESAAPVVERVAAPDATNDGKGLAQGLRGKVLDPFGRPLADADIYLMRGSTNNLFVMMSRAAKGIVYPPLAHARTDNLGAFTLGTDNTEDNSFELRAFHPGYVEHRMPNLQIVANEWYELDPIKLEQGAVVRGRVEIAGTGGLPVPAAEVFVQGNSGMLDISPTPGLERGLAAKVDAAGNYRFDNAPTGVVNISAVAPNYARIEKSNTVVAAQGETEVNFELPSGMALAGTVRDTSNAPVPNARIEAYAISSKQPAKGDCRSDENGKFEIIGLLEGPYVVTAIAPGFVKKEVKPIQSGEQSLELQLERQGSARLRVFGLNGKRLSSYQYTVKKHFEGKDQFGNTDLPTRSARPDVSGITTVEGLDPDSYVFQVEAQGLAKAYSEPFVVALGGEAPIVDVQMNEGGTIEGTVTGAGGKPVAGVDVLTLPNHFQDNPFFAMLGGLVPYKITRTATKTDADGRFKLTLLSPGTYQVKLAHPDYFEVAILDKEVQTGQTASLGNIAMNPGTVVSGLTRVGGKPTGQIKVTINNAPDPTSSATVNLFHCEAISGSDGKFTLPKRIPPGRYQVMAARQTLSNPMLQIADFAKTKQEIVLSQGQKQFTLNFQIPDDIR